MSVRSQRMCTLSGPLAFVAVGVGIWPVAHFLPPLLPSASAEDIAAIYRANPDGIRLGAILFMVGASLFIPFFTQFSVLMKRMEGENTPLALTQAIGAAVVVTLFFLPGIMFSLAAFRPERPAEMLQLVNDLGWLLLVIPVMPAFVQTMAIGLAILSDEKPVPVMPRWTGYFSIWLAVLFLPGCLAAMFKSGPFAWNGLLAFWLPVGMFGFWAVTMTFPMLKAISQEKPRG
jgi:hypothetical protein